MMISSGIQASLATGSIRLRRFALRDGFYLVILAIFLFFSLATPHFHEIGNLISLVHAMSPLLVIASGLALVVIAGQLDISVGSTAFLSSTVGAVLMVRYGFNPLFSCLVTLAVGALLGAINGFIVVMMRVNPLIATLGTMIAFRGAALQLTAARTIDLPDGLLQINDFNIVSIPIDVFIALAIVIVIHLVHRSTTFGRHITAIGNGTELAQRIGLPVKRLVFRNFVLCGLLASVGGLMSTLQIGSVTAYMGIGLEFSAVAAVVVGGISLFGGRGSVLKGVILGALTFEMIRNGLNHLGANPYAYRLVSGTVIFLAMYADALKPSLKKAGSILERT
jgi:ribose/xylose/arabinose/galactoside ABC-type transport system permease subunit